MSSLYADNPGNVSDGPSGPGGAVPQASASADDSTAGSPAGDPQATAAKYAQITNDARNRFPSKVCTRVHPTRRSDRVLGPITRGECRTVG